MNLSDFCCGLVSGWTQIIVGQPFDFIKVRIQTAKNNPTSLSYIFKDIYKQYGLKGFYRGSSSLFFGFAFTIGVQFLVYQWSKKTLFKLFGSRNGEYNPNLLQLWQVGVSGGIVGSVVSLFYCPVQYVKIQKQLNQKMVQSSLNLLFKQIKQSGIKNIYRGFWATFFKQAIGTVFYYSSYQATVRAYTKKNRETASSLMFLNAGAIAGLSYHLVTYPIDTIKTNMQFGKTFKQAFKISFQLQKLKGYKVVLIRASLVNAFSFLAYQKCQKAINKINNIYYSPY